MEKTLTEKKGKFCLDKKALEYIIPIIHFLLTFILERKCFVFSGNWDFVNEIPRNDYISDTAEMVIVYILSKICAAIIIILLWKLIFGVINRRITKSIVILFGVIYLLGLIVGLFLYPTYFSLSIDNFTNYAMAIRFLPTYWQSVYTGVVYGGCMMIIPHPFGIFAFQWMAFVAVVAYVYAGVERLFSGKNVKYLTLLLFLLPETYYMVFDAYRNNYYAMLCLFYFAYLIFTLRDREKQCKTGEMVAISLLSAFLMVWRSEGILIGAGGMLILLFAYKADRKKAASLLLVCIGAFLVLNAIQGIGAKKYYGQDYMIVNTTDVLCSIFNDPNANLTYEGAEEDLAAIEAVVPVQVLKEAGMTGYRNYNWTSGRPNFNQTLADDETADRYMSAYYRIIFNNVQGYLNVQINSFFGAMQIDARHITYSYTGENLTNLEAFDYYRWQLGNNDFRDTFRTIDWESNKVRQFMYSVESWFITVWRELWSSTGINVLLHSCAIIADVVLLVVELIQFFIYKEKKSMEYIIYFLVLLGETAAIVLFMPVGRAAYLYPVLYVSYFVIYFYILEHTGKKKEVDISTD